MKKLLALSLVIVMSVFVFSACEEKEAPAAAESAVVKTIAEECLTKLVQLDDSLLKLTVAEKGGYNILSSKLTALKGLGAKFDAAIDSWEIADDAKATLKAYAAEKVQAIESGYSSGGVIGSTVTEDAANVNCTALLLNTAATGYSAAFTVDETEKAIKDMTPDEQKVLVETIAAKVQECVVETEVAFMLRVFDGEWLIVNAGVSAIE